MIEMKPTLEGTRPGPTQRPLAAYLEKMRGSVFVRKCTIQLDPERWQSASRAHNVWDYKSILYPKDVVVTYISSHLSNIFSLGNPQPLLHCAGFVLHYLIDLGLLRHHPRAFGVLPSDFVTNGSFFELVDPDLNFSRDILLLQPAMQPPPVMLYCQRERLIQCIVIAFAP